MQRSVFSTSGQPRNPVGRGLILSALLAALPVLAAGANVVWSIGTANNSADEFASGSTGSLVYDVSERAGATKWRERQEASGQGYSVRFLLPEAPPSAAALVIGGFFMEAGPRALVLEVNGRRGSFRLVPEHGPDLDMRQGSMLTHTRVSLRIPIEASFLKQGANEMSITLSGDGRLYYDFLRLEKSGEAVREDLGATVEPTVFFRRAGGQLKEVTEVVIRHQRPLQDASVSLKVGAVVVAGKLTPDGIDFGEHVVDLDVPALA